MTVDRIVHAVAGTFILLSLALAKFHNPNWIWFTVFVGCKYWLFVTELGLDVQP